MTGAVELRKLCSRLCVNRVTIVTDNDSAKVRFARGVSGKTFACTRFRPGIDGAQKLADDLGLMYRIVTPPKKDLRDWVMDGCTARTFRTVAELQPWRMPRSASRGFDSHTAGRAGAEAAEARAANLRPEARR